MAIQTSSPIDQRGHPDITWRGTHSLDEREGIIREAAYYLYEQGGCGHGRHVDDWLAAEAALDHGTRELQPAGLAEFEMQQPVGLIFISTLRQSLPLLRQQED